MISIPTTINNTRSLATSFLFLAVILYRKQTNIYHHDHDHHNNRQRSIAIFADATKVPSLRTTFKNVATTTRIRGGGTEEGSSVSKRVELWSYEKPCKRMECTPVPPSSLFSTKFIKHNDNNDVDGGIEDLEDDLVVICIPPHPSILNQKNEDDDDENDEEDIHQTTEETIDDDNKEEENQKKNHMSIQFVSPKVKQLDSYLGKILSKSMTEEQSTFKDGKVLGKMTPMIRVPVKRKKRTKKKNKGTTEGSQNHTMEENIEIRRYILLGLGKLDNLDSDSTYGQGQQHVGEGTFGRSVRHVREYFGFRRRIKREDHTTEKDRLDKEEIQKIHHKYKALGRRIGSTIASKCIEERGIKTCSIVIPEFALGKSSCGGIIDTGAEGPCPVLSELISSFLSGLYSDDRYRTGSRQKKHGEKLHKVTIVIERAAVTGVDNQNSTDDTEKSEANEDEALIEKGSTLASPTIISKITQNDAKVAIERGCSLASGVYLARDIVNSPHNVLNSVSLADLAQRIADESGGLIKCRILDRKECERRGMGAYLGVARGSETEPKFIHLTYKPRMMSGKIVRKVGIIGKGLLFDTGGYNLKTSMMELMKFDCGGAAAVLGAARSVAAIAPEGVEASFVVAACENMINERAVVPGDVLTAANGKTIEVVNTDAEGRLTMADALVYVDKELGCQKILELSTLTGACMVSLGNSVAGLWTSNDELSKEIEVISASTGEKIWRMPLEKEYEEQLESKIADLKNLGGRYGGAITAALFLQHFVSKKKPFAHVDMAGPVWKTKSGATGYGSKMVAEWVCIQGKG